MSELLTVEVELEYLSGLEGEIKKLKKKNKKLKRKVLSLEQAYEREARWAWDIYYEKCL